MKKLLTTVTLMILLSGCYYDVEEELYPDPQVACGSAPVSYSREVAPLISANCMSCHSQSANMGSVNLEGYDQVKTYAMSGKLYGVLSHASGFSPMPKGGAKLSDCNLAIIKKWIDDGSLNN